MEDAVGKIEARKILNEGYHKVLVHTKKPCKITVKTTTKINKTGKTIKVTKPGVTWPKILNYERQVKDTRLF